MIEKGDVAILIAALSATFTGLSLLHSRKLAKNDSLRMKRKSVSWELHSAQSAGNEPWIGWYLVVRNVEPYSAKVTGARAKPRQGFLLLATDAQSQEDVYGNPSGFDTTLAGREIIISRQVHPTGTATGMPGVSPVQTIRLFTQGISSVKDIDLKWEWSDGTPI